MKKKLVGEKFDIWYIKFDDHNKTLYSWKLFSGSKVVAIIQQKESPSKRNCPDDVFEGGGVGVSLFLLSFDFEFLSLFFLGDKLQLPHVEANVFFFLNEINKSRRNETFFFFFLENDVAWESIRVKNEKSWKLKAL